jgi:hypothetical protein
MNSEPGEPVDAAEPGDGQRNGARVRLFGHDGRDWIAIVDGSGVAGTGRFSSAGVQLLRFAHADAPDQPVREILTQLRTLDDLYDAELVAYLIAAPLVTPPRNVAESGRPGPHDPGFVDPERAMHEDVIPDEPE